jgi:glycosyltransferase involved in cell wall biosynthesis
MKSTDRPRIALALEYPLMQQGGTEVLVREFIRGLSREFEIVLVSGDKSLKELPEDLSSLICDHVWWDSRARNVAAAKEVASALVQKEVKLAHFHFGGTFVWESNRFWRCPVYYFARTGVPCLTTNHLATEWLNCGVNPIRPVWQKHLYQLFAIFSRSMIYRRLKLEVCVSKHDLARVQRMFPMFRGKLTQRYHSLLPATAPEPELKNREPVILCIGTIGGRKAQPNLAEAFGRIGARYPEWRVDFIGRTADGGDVGRIQACAARYGLNGRINLLGRLSDEETLHRMRRGAIIAMPSLQEGLGLSLQEAIFHGCVAVGSRAGGIPELIDDEVNGLVVPPGDIPALSGALERLLSDPGLVEKFRAQARPSILRKGMTASAMVEGYFQCYEQILAESAANQPVHVRAIW